MTVRQSMARQPRRPSRSDPSTLKSARAVQRAIRRDNPAKEPPTVGKPVIVDPAGPPPGPTDNERQTKRRNNRKDRT
jgi:hypothetical protein